MLCMDLPYTMGCMLVWQHSHEELKAWQTSMRFPSEVLGTTMNSLDCGGTLSGSATPLTSPLIEDPMVCLFLHTGATMQGPWIMPKLYGKAHEGAPIELSIRVEVHIMRFWGNT